MLKPLYDQDNHTSKGSTAANIGLIFIDDSSP